VRPSGAFAGAAKDVQVGRRKNRAGVLSHLSGAQVWRKHPLAFFEDYPSRRQALTSSRRLALRSLCEPEENRGPAFCPGISEGTARAERTNGAPEPATFLANVARPTREFSSELASVKENCERT